ncbi:hypothetical protein [Afifella marina]|uniref:Uncharacterized protein n=1 Tax=Afifella marina DSM 2698 TaxID=1120955 RepID=A0A1G5P6C1_AFIMA|nr:hypothetical protein [Afifella marina]MBK1625156.1 hypothetical protein [Afifella marina DSM 2698]MBK1627060.1 hypothetical protein [Afifella marina]MBK5919397.1 hypothetical protein [Afifella marina]RAI19617.1 hypothetical protein CH311_12515 [Afifella marina DSM 2698]SCZ44828.1 hypothetical protein SAMN03080610_03302 [Afifella marina DSM 2698]
MSNHELHGHAGRPPAEALTTTRESDKERLAAERLDRELDEGLEESFPASDPPAPTQPHKEVDED